MKRSAPEKTTDAVPTGAALLKLEAVSWLEFAWGKLKEALESSGRRSSRRSGGAAA
jgi:hypothetical protein